MKAAVLKELKSPLVVEDRPIPEPGPGQVRVRLHAAALNRRDHWITSGLYACPSIALQTVSLLQSLRTDHSSASVGAICSSGLIADLNLRQIDGRLAFVR